MSLWIFLPGRASPDALFCSDWGRIWPRTVGLQPRMVSIAALFFHKHSCVRKPQCRIVPVCRHAMISSPLAGRHHWADSVRKQQATAHLLPSASSAIRDCQCTSPEASYVKASGKTQQTTIRGETWKASSARLVREDLSDGKGF
jgi:hypothetical protein